MQMTPVIPVHVTAPPCPHPQFAAHRRIMQRLYLLACIVTGAFTLLPQSYLGHLLGSGPGLA